MTTIDITQRLIFFGDQAVELTPESLAVALDQPSVEWISFSCRPDAGGGNGRGADNGWRSSEGWGWGQGRGRGSGEGNGRGDGTGWGGGRWGTGEGDVLGGGGWGSGSANGQGDGWGSGWCQYEDDGTL